MTQTDSLLSLGWRPYFQAQLDEDAAGLPARVIGVHRGRVDIAGIDGLETIDLAASAIDFDITIGDWVVVDIEVPKISRVLERFGLFKRRAAGTAATTQSIAANVDTLFIVTSANRDFNIARIERYLAIAHEAGAFPVVVVTKADTVDAVAPFVAEAAALSPALSVEAIDARDPDSAAVLRAWCDAGQTIALLGSSGVGKSTLINSLTGSQQATSATREDDQRGRHTTTGRSMHRLPSGGWLIDTPGMRELKLVDVGDALDDVFTEIAALAERCRFGDCTHGNEPGCAVQAALASGTLDPDRLRRYEKLVSEDRRNTETVAERRSRDRHFARLYKSIQSDKRRQKGNTE